MKKFVDLSCPTCGTTVIDAFVVIPEYGKCSCGSDLERLFLPSSVPSVVGDDIPGGVEIKHGICNPDGTPKKYYSHSEIRKAAEASGLVSRPERGVADKKDWDRLSQKV